MTSVLLTGWTGSYQGWKSGIVEAIYTAAEMDTCNHYIIVVINISSF